MKIDIKDIARLKIEKGEVLFIEVHEETSKVALERLQLALCAAGIRADRFLITRAGDIKSIKVIKQDKS
jgi:hypothetical protein